MTTFADFCCHSLYVS